MNNACIATAVMETFSAAGCIEASAGAAPLEALARALGYTDRELAIAGGVLNQYTWHVPARHPQSGKAGEGEPDDSSPDRKRAA